MDTRCFGRRTPWLALVERAKSHPRREATRAARAEVLAWFGPGTPKSKTTSANNDLSEVVMSAHSGLQWRPTFGGRAGKGSS